MKTVAQLPVNSINNLRGHVTYQIEGFDRINFVNDIMNTVPEAEDYMIRAISFEVNGWLASGLLTIQVREENRQINTLIHKLRAISGVVRVREVIS